MTYDEVRLHHQRLRVDALREAREYLADTDAFASVDAVLALAQAFERYLADGTVPDHAVDEEKA